MTSMERAVTECVAESLGLSAKDVGRDGFQLQSAGSFSSFALLELVVRLEERFGITIPDADLTLERFASVSAIEAYVVERGGSPPE